jgi:hypothetical protein
LPLLGSKDNFGGVTVGNGSAVLVGTEVFVATGTKLLESVITKDGVSDGLLSCVAAVTAQPDEKTRI